MKETIYQLVAGKLAVSSISQFGKTGEREKKMAPILEMFYEFLLLLCTIEDHKD